MPGKYQPLADWLAAQPVGSVRLTFAEVEQILGMPLPPSARADTGWWKSGGPGHVQAQAWLSVGWRVEAVHRLQAWVLYRRQQPGAAPAGP